MAVMTIRNIDAAIKERLRIRAALRGHSMEEEARDILRSALCVEAPQVPSIGEAIHARFAALGGVDLTLPARDPMRAPPDFAE